MNADYTVHLVDSDQAAREQTAALVSSWGPTCEQHASAEDFLSAPCRPASGCLLVEHSLAGIDGLALQDRLIARQDSIPVVVATREPTVELAVRYMQKGAISVLAKPCDAHELRAAIDLAAAVDTRRNELRQRYQELQTSDQALTDRERQVKNSIVGGKLNKVIAGDLGVSVRTVEHIRARVLRKFHAVTAADLAAKSTELQVLADTVFRFDRASPERLPLSGLTAQGLRGEPNARSAAC